MEVIARMSQYKQGDMLASAVPSAPLHDKSLIRGHSAAYEQYLLLSICHPSPQYTLQPLSSPMSQVFCLCTVRNVAAVQRGEHARPLMLYAGC
ncbi:hypothetical protein COCVIDRAFT_22391 [Bipolaris victoriae FI3]|uniref:Uncharacterized protein n=1 Tax=Bipolaris victoriae (strain FI3) TaxID=930091 RepID=W7EVN3_BIPV3|nr:hypothetical protein COCVIDRAFT_22391 [Bipolaris victoriae FI3]